MYYNDANQLSRIVTESTAYNFVYDVFGNTTNISVGDLTLAGDEYNSNTGKPYDTAGNVFAIEDHVNAKVVYYKYGNSFKKAT